MKSAHSQLLFPKSISKFQKTSAQSALPAQVVSSLEPFSNPMSLLNDPCDVDPFNVANKKWVALGKRWVAEIQKIINLKAWKIVGGTASTKYNTRLGAMCSTRQNT